MNRTHARRGGATIRWIAALAALCAAPSGLEASDARSSLIGSSGLAGQLAPLPGSNWSGGGASGWTGGRGAGRAIDLPRGNPLTDRLELTAAERELFADAGEGRLRRLTLLDAGLVACGADDSAANYARERFYATRSELAQLLTQEAQRGSDELRRVQLVHQVLHQRLLGGGYDPNATNLAATLQSGVYNCASATLLFVALASDLNISAQAMKLPGHVRAVVECVGEPYEIEVTCPAWNSAVRRLSSGQFQSQENGRVVSPLGLVAMIYYNRGVDAFNERRFGESLAANRRALLLDPQDNTARGNMLAAVNNWALALCDAGYYAEAEHLLADGQQFEPNHATFAHNAAHVLQVWTQMKAGAQKTGPAVLPSL
jgi:hypothetical protein